MKSDHATSANARTVPWSDGSGSRPVPEGLEAKCRCQEMVIDTLGEALSTFERGARALKAENSALRAEHDRLRRCRRFASQPDGRVDGGEPADAARLVRELRRGRPDHAELVAPARDGERAYAGVLT